jgi:hypothetical protein
MRAMILAALVALAGCTTTAGPFISTISSDGAGQLHVSKCMVSFNGFLGVVSSTDCTAVVIPIGQGEKKAK